MFLLFALGFFQLGGRRCAGRFTNKFAAGWDTENVNVRSVAIREAFYISWNSPSTVVTHVDCRIKIVAQVAFAATFSQR